MKKIRNVDLQLTIDIQIDLLNKIIKPILLYGCELYGVGNIDALERIQLKFYKRVLNLKKYTPSNTWGNAFIYWTKVITQLEMARFLYAYVV